MPAIPIPENAARAVLGRFVRWRSVAACAICLGTSCTPLTGMRTSASETPARDGGTTSPERREPPESEPEPARDASVVAHGGRTGGAGSAGDDEQDKSSEAGRASEEAGAGAAGQPAVSAGTGGIGASSPAESPALFECVPSGVNEIIGQRLEVLCETPLSLAGDEIEHLALGAQSTARARERFLELAISAFVKRKTLRVTVIPSGTGNSEGCPAENCRTLRAFSIAP